MRRTLLGTAVMLAGCSHISHGAYVDRGFAVGAELGGFVAQMANPGRTEEPSPATRSSLDVQLRAGYGWRFDSTKVSAMSLTLVVPTRVLYGTQLDVYLQLGSGALDWGAGALLGLAPELYLEVGHRFERAGAEISAGARIGRTNDENNDWTPLFTAFALLTIGAGKNWRVGLWGEYQDPKGVLRLCDENCDTHPNYVDYSLAGGLTVTLTFGAPDAAPERAPQM